MRRFGACRVHARTPGGFGLLGFGTRCLGTLEIPGDLLLAGIDGRLNLRDHPARYHEEDEAKRDRQPQELRQIDGRELRELRHGALL